MRTKPPTPEESEEIIPIRRRIPPPMPSVPELKPEEIIGSSVFQSGTHAPVPHCYGCGKVGGSGMRAINAEEHLYICRRCDTLREEETPKRSLPASQEETAEPVELKDAICDICKGPILDEKKLERRLRKINSADISQRDKDRIERMVRMKGWKYLGKGIYVHTRCQ